MTSQNYSQLGDDPRDLIGKYVVCGIRSGIAHVRENYTEFDQENKLLVSIVGRLRELGLSDAEILTKALAESRRMEELQIEARIGLPVTEAKSLDALVAARMLTQNLKDGKIL